MKPILGIHGVSEGGNAKIKSTFGGEAIAGVASLATQLGHPIDAKAIPYAVAAYADEINALARPSIPSDYSALSLVQRFPVLAPIASLVSDYIQDAFTYAGEGAEQIKALVRSEIIRRGPCVVFAHSLGSVIAVDILTDMLGEGLISARVPKSEWPIQALLTFGSPLGINIPFYGHIGYQNRLVRLRHTRPTPPDFRWVNLYDTNDPIVSGSVLGLPGRAVPLSKHPVNPNLGLSVKDVEVDTGRHLLSHIAYPENFILHQHLYALCFCA